MKQILFIKCLRREAPEILKLLTCINETDYFFIMSCGDSLKYFKKYYLTSTLNHGENLFNQKRGPEIIAARFKDHNSEEKNNH